MASSIKRVLNFEDAKRLDKFAQEFTKIPGNQWMGWAALSLFHTYKNLFNSHKEIIILCGRGNNGGDGYALAYFLQTEGHSVQILAENNPQSEEAIYYRDLITLLNVPIDDLNKLEKFLQSIQSASHSTLIVDCLYGIGGRLPLSKQVLEIMNQLHKFKNSTLSKDSHFLSIDAISGRNPMREWTSIEDTKIDPSFFPADTLAEIGSIKWENFGFPNEKKIYVPIGFPSKEFIEQNVLSQNIFQLTPLSIKSLQKSFLKSDHSHKYKAGSCLFYGGEEGMEGAILLSQSAFMGLGGGIAKVNSLSKQIWNHKESINPSLMINTESIRFWEDPFFQKAKAMVWGPGTSVPNQNEDVVPEEWKQIINYPEKSFIIDAGRIPSYSIIQNHSDLIFHPNCIFTAHFGEFNRMTECRSKKWFARIENGIEFARKMNAYILLKESYSILFSPNGEIYIWDEPNPKLATMGTGDLLTGILALYLSRKFCVLESVQFALSAMNLSKQMNYNSPSSWEILEYLKKV
jgi:ADP-dependent NAD(P)H-hydrate dehydratase / NAD(P)H-hydrate epimerase